MTIQFIRNSVGKSGLSRFFGWMIVGILTFGIAFLWIGPYMRTATARFYDDLLTE